MDEDDAITLALLGISGCYKEADIETHGTKYGSQCPENRDEFAGQRIESAGGAVFEPVDHDAILFQRNTECSGGGPR